MSIKIYYDQIRFRIQRSGEIKKFLEKVIRDKGKMPGDLKFIFTDDEKILEINNKFLKHNYYTDVISFDDSKGKNVNGEIYISMETLKRNADQYNVRIKEEIVRVMVHGLLHLCGYNDDNRANKSLMIGIQESLVKELANKI